MNFPDGDGEPELGDVSLLEPAFDVSAFVDAVPDSFDREQAVKTGTTTVGIDTEDGVVLAADRRASFGGRVTSKRTKKIHQLHPTAAATISGGLSPAQALARNVSAERRLYEVRRDRDMSITALATVVANLLQTGAFTIAVPLLGGVDRHGTHLISYDGAGGMIEEEYSVTGSGGQYALGVLEREYEPGLGLSEAQSVAIRAVQSALERDTATGDGATIAKVTADGVEIRVYDTVDSIPDPDSF